MFSEYSMSNPRQLAEYVGFTETEVEELCERYHMNLKELKEWYDGYSFDEIGSIYSPRSVIEASEALRNSAKTLRSIWERRPEEVCKVLVGINYDKQTREHECVIEEFQK